MAIVRTRRRTAAPSRFQIRHCWRLYHATCRMLTLGTNYASAAATLRETFDNIRKVAPSWGLRAQCQRFN